MTLVLMLPNVTRLTDNLITVMAQNISYSSFCTENETTIKP